MTGVTQSERGFQAAVLEFAALRGWLCFHPFDSRRSQAGFPDLVLVRDRVIFVELKAPQGRISPDQHQWIDALENAGAQVYVWRPADWPEIEAALL